MKIDTTLSDQHAPADVPAAAALAAPTAANAISELPAGADAELLELGRQLAPLVAEANTAKSVPQDDKFWSDMLDRQAEILKQILAIQPTTKEGLAVQVWAVINVDDDILDQENLLELPPELITFLRNVCAYTGVPLPA
jgi:hypothetical protein